MEATSTMNTQTNDTREAAHTAGLWRYEASTKTIRSVPANYWLATMDSWDGAVDHEANARLIAAAPELLEAAKLGAHAIRELLFQVPRGFSPGLREEFNLQLKVLEEAIAKATGQTLT
jgi:hypothetical protein